MNEPIVVGTVVTYTRKFLKSCNFPATSLAWKMRGRVTEMFFIGQCLLALVQWEDEGAMKVRVDNLIAVKNIHLEAV